MLKLNFSYLPSYFSQANNLYHLHCHNLRPKHHDPIDSDCIQMNDKLLLVKKIIKFIYKRQIFQFMHQTMGI